MDLFDKFTARTGTPIVGLARQTYGKATFPKLTGQIGPRMTFAGRRHAVWNVNNYLGLANHPEVRAVDAAAAARYGLAAPMGSRMMSGESDQLELLEDDLADFSGYPSALFLNYGYMGMLSLIDELLSRGDWLIYDSHSHACVLDGVRLHMSRAKGRARSFGHNDIGRLERVLNQVQRLRAPDEAVLVVTEGVFGMSGAQGRLGEIAQLKRRFGFRLLVDDAHGFGVLGRRGRGVGEEQDVQDDIDLYFATFTKAGAGTGAFVASQPEVIWRLRHGMRSQVFSRGLPLAVVVGNRTRLRLMRTEPERRARCLQVARTVRAELSCHGLSGSQSATPITPVYLDLDPGQAARFVDDLRHRHSTVCSVVAYPVVPVGTVQLRIVATAEHTEADARELAAAISMVYQHSGRDHARPATA